MSIWGDTIHSKSPFYANPHRSTFPPMPQIALISDIHGNIDALEAVLNDIKGQEVDEIVCLGDIVGYGGAPAECLKLVRERCSVTVMGNHDEFLVRGFENFVLSRRIADPLRHAMKSLGSEEMEWLRSLPYTAGVHEFTVTHASLAIAPEAFNYLNTDMVAAHHFQQQSTAVCFIGHTHRPEMVTDFKGRIGWGLIWEGKTLLDRSKKCAVNVGSVGQPRDDNPNAAYGIYDSGMGLFTLRRVAYDIETAIRRIKEAGIPEENALRLFKGE